MRMRSWYAPAAAVMTALLACGLTNSAGADRSMPVAIIADFTNTSRDRHSTLSPTATDAVAVELMKRNVYEVLSRSELERTAKNLGLRAPFRPDDLLKVARELKADVIVTGEIASISNRGRDESRGIEAGLIVRVKDVELEELVNGAAVRAYSSESADGQKTEGAQALDAVTAAAFRAVQRIAAYQPVTGTILNNSTTRGLVLNRGSGHGIKRRQEFIIFRNNIAVGRARVTAVSPSYSELIVTDNTLGIQGQDRALAVFPEPKFD
jgi:hypothetical protein